MMKNSKKGITLVESMFAVVILGILTIGIVSLLSVGGAKIIKISNEASAQAEAVQKMDQVIAAISNGCGVVKDEANNTYTLLMKTPADQPDADNPQTGLLDALDFDDVTLNVTAATHASDGSLRGWYLTLTYRGVTVSGFASNSEGAFD